MPYTPPPNAQKQMLGLACPLALLAARPLVLAHIHHLKNLQGLESSMVPTRYGQFLMRYEPFLHGTDSSCTVRTVPHAGRTVPTRYEPFPMRYGQFLHGTGRSYAVINGSYYSTIY